MPGLLADLVDELRNAGIPVSVGEHLDAAAAAASIPLNDREVLRAALAATLVKDGDHLGAFNLIFDLYTSGPPPGQGESPLAGLDDAGLQDVLRGAIASDDRMLMSLVADEYVRRFAGVEAGRPVAGVMYGIAVNRAADLDGIRADLLAAGGGGAGAGGSGLGGGGGGGGLGGEGSRAGDDGAGDDGLPGMTSLRDRLAQAEAERAISRFRAEIEASIRRVLVADRGARAVRATMRVGLAQDKDIASASGSELQAMTSAIGPLAQQLTQVLSRQARRPRRPSIRGTLRRSMATGGVPFRIVTEPARPPKPEIVVLCDVSGSVAAFSRFTLELLVALDSRLSRLRIFAFTDGVAEITGLVGEARAAGVRLPLARVQQETVRLDGGSDYGHVLRTFAAGHARELTQRTALLVVGDARTNYLNPAVASFAELARRAGQVYWLNPEPRSAWNDGDSVIGAYSSFCDQVQECRNLRQITAFVGSLAARQSAGRAR
ncbi:MAG TPA: VWA domain-containing protein [Streptosporangiaceae bacterium]